VAVGDGPTVGVSLGTGEGVTDGVAEGGAVGEGGRVAVAGDVGRVVRVAAILVARSKEEGTRAVRVQAARAKPKTRRDLRARVTE
jgi:hypothetical protein